MNSSIHLIVVNLFATLVFFGGILFYWCIFPKKRISPLLLVILLSLLPMISILRKGVYQSGDFTIHIKLAMQFFQNLQQAIFVPQWMPSHCSGYGCPTYIFLSPLPYYFLSLFYVITSSFISSMKIYLVSCFVFSGVGMYLWMKNEINEKAGVVAAICYLYAPYHLIDIHFRVSVGEVLSMTLLPFAFLSTKLFIERKKIYFFVTTAALLGLLILAHQVTSLVTFPFLILYSYITWLRKSKRQLVDLIVVLSSLTFGLLLSAFFWIPVIFESKFTQFTHSTFVEFKPIQEFIFSPYRYGLLFQGHMGELVFTVGYMQWLIILIAFYYVIKNKFKKKEKKITIILLVLSGLLLVMMNKVSEPLWHVLPLLKSFQFSWRLSLELIVIISILASLVINTINKSIVTILFCTATILYTILNWGNRQMLPTISDSTLASEILFTETPGHLEITTPVWVDSHSALNGVQVKSHIDVLKGTATIAEKIRKINLHLYIISSTTGAKLKENTYYYPGWTLLLDNKKIPFTYKDKKYAGVIIFDIPPGIHEVRLEFKDTPVRYYSKLISLFTGFFCFVLILKSFHKKKVKKNLKKTKI